jgi:hypothetical protein
VLRVHDWHALHDTKWITVPVELSIEILSTAIILFPGFRSSYFLRCCVGLVFSYIALIPDYPGEWLLQPQWTGIARQNVRSQLKSTLQRRQQHPSDTDQLADTKPVTTIITTACSSCSYAISMTKASPGDGNWAKQVSGIQWGSIVRNTMTRFEPRI